MIGSKNNQGVIANAVLIELVDDGGERVVEPSLTSGNGMLASCFHLIDNLLP